VPRAATLSGLSLPKPVAAALHRACVRARRAPLGERCSADAAPSRRTRGHVPPSSTSLVKEVPAATFRECHPHTQDLDRERRRINRWCPAPFHSSHCCSPIPTYHIRHYRSVSWGWGPWAPVEETKAAGNGAGKGATTADGGCCIPAHSPPPIASSRRC
jgi:hypothetical protein